MATANTTQREIAPTHPGEMLREDFLPDYGLTASTLAAALAVSRQTIHELPREQRAITPLMALRPRVSLAIRPPSGSTPSRPGTSGNRNAAIAVN